MQCLIGGALEGARSRGSRIDGTWADARGVSEGVSRRGALRGVSAGAAVAGRVCLSRVRRQGARRGFEEPPAAFRMPRLRPADLADRRHGDASVEIAADDMVLGRARDGDALQRHVGATIGRPARRHLQDGLAADAEAPALDDRSRPRSSRRRRRGGSDGNSFRAGDAFFEPGAAGKILVAGAVEVIDRSAGKPKPRRRGAKYLDTRSGRVRLAVIADNSAKSIEAFVRANVKPGATLITDGHASYPGLSGDYRHDPRVVGNMAANIILPWSHRAFSLMKRWALGTYHGLRRKHVDVYLDEFVFRYNRRFHRHVSFETVLGLAAHGRPQTYWDIIQRDNPRKSAVRTQLLHLERPETTG